MKLITYESILYRLPKELPIKEFLIFDAVRFTLEIIDFNYNSLIRQLVRTSETNKRQAFKVFSRVWNIIDYSNKVKDLLTELPWENQKEVLGALYPIKDFRDTFQHLGIRSNTALSEKTAIYGVLTWFYRQPKTTKLKLHQLISGVGRRTDVKVIVPNVDKFKRKINHVELHTVKKKAVIKIEIGEIVSDLIDLRKDLEKRIVLFYKEHNLATSNWDDRRDIHVIINPDGNK